MTASQGQVGSSPPQRPWLQFGLRTMLLLFVVFASSLAVFGVWGIVVFALTVGLAIYLCNVRSLWSQLPYLLIALFLLCLQGLVTDDTISRECSRRLTCRNNLRQIASALDEYRRANGRFPPAYISDSSGKPMHSWRALILPYLDRNDLYKACNFTQRWDSPQNAKQLPSALRTYTCPSDAYVTGTFQTSYVAVVGPNAAWRGEKTRPLEDFPDRGASTIMLVEVTDSRIPWAEPRDVSLNEEGAIGPNSPALAIGTHHDDRDEFFYRYRDTTGLHVVTADGRVRILKTAGLANEQVWKKLQVGACREEDFGSDDTLTRERRLNWRNIAALAVWLLSVGTLLTIAILSRKRPAVCPPTVAG